MLTNILGVFSCLCFFIAWGASAPLTTSLCEKKIEINLELTGGNKRGRGGQGVARVAWGATLIFALHAKTFWLCFLFPHSPLKSRLTCLAAMLRWCVCVGFWSCL